MTRTIHECAKCGAAFGEPGDCEYCLTSLSAATIIECAPMESGKHFRLNKELALVLMEMAGKNCEIRIKEIPCAK